MREYRFSLTRILPYKDRIVDSDLIRENMGQWKPAFSLILRSVRREQARTKCRYVNFDWTCKYQPVLSTKLLWNYLPKLCMEITEIEISHTDRFYWWAWTHYLVSVISYKIRLTVLSKILSETCFMKCNTIHLNCSTNTLN